MPKVYNKYHGDAPPDAVYIGRGSIWGNPYVIGKDGNREEVIKMYEKKIEEQCRILPHFRKSCIINPLKGKDLVCFCAPKPCHGDILLKIANEQE